MADFRPAFEFMLKNEGGYILHEVPGDTGGMTYAGIARNFHPTWKGWGIIDSKNMDNPLLTDLVVSFYKDAFWSKIKGDDIRNQKIAESLFDFAVNTGVRTAIKLAQIVVNTTPDGIIGMKTIAAINNMSADEFIPKFVISKLARYVDICKRNNTQKKFLYGWCYRLLKGL